MYLQHYPVTSTELYLAVTYTRPFGAHFERDALPGDPLRIIEVLRPFINADRFEKIEHVCRERTCTVVPVIEGLINQGNINAVMRTAEGLGYLPFHIVETQSAFKNANRTSQGAEKWLEVVRWQAPADFAQHVKQAGYRIAVTHLDTDSVPLSELDFTQPTALVFGNEQEGVSQEMIEVADVKCIVPMTGFVQSFNISVAAALILYHARQDRLVRAGRHGDLNDDERLHLQAEYCMRALKNANAILKSHAL